MKKLSLALAAATLLALAALSAPAQAQPHLGDHVLAAAITGHADAIVTWNEKDFPREVLDPFGIEVQTPDEFVLNQLMLEKLTALAALKRMRERWARPQYDAIALVALLEKRGLPQTAAHLRDVVALI